MKIPKIHQFYQQLAIKMIFNADILAKYGNGDYKDVTSRRFSQRVPFEERHTYETVPPYGRQSMVIDNGLELRP